MKLALLTEANPHRITKSHPSFVGPGKYRIVATDVKSKLVGRRIPHPFKDGLITAINLGDVFEGSCLVEILVLEAHPEDTLITVTAEKIDV